MTVYHSEKELLQDQVRYNKQLINYFTSLHEGKSSSIDSLSRITPEMDYEHDIAELTKAYQTPIAIIDFLTEENKRLRKQVKNFLQPKYLES